MPKVERTDGPDHALATPELRKRSLFSTTFLYVRPEPVLANARFLYGS
jgi:hypothetical protein